MATNVDPRNTCKILHEAGEKLLGLAPTVYADSGVENVNGLVDALHDSGSSGGCWPRSRSQPSLFLPWPAAADVILDAPLT
ncbi:MAG: hypothetical protein ABIW57_05710 [Polyangia bacterium]